MKLTNLFIVWLFFLLLEFKFVFLKEISSGLSTTRNIEYQIDFVVGVVIQNRLSYRKNLKKRKEL